MTAVSKRTPALDSLSAASSTFLIPVSKIRVPTNHRKHSAHAVQAMAENIDIQGQLQAVTVMTDADGYRLVFGALRLAAIRSLNQADIRAEIKTPEAFPTEASERLASIVENMARARLCALDRSVAIADWCAIYQAAKPYTKPGPKPKDVVTTEFGTKFVLNSDDEDLQAASLDFSRSFSDAAQFFFDVSRGSIFNALKIASISSIIRERISLRPLADQQSELLALAAEPAERQEVILDLIIGGKAASVADAIAAIDMKPRAVPAAWEALTQKFTRMGEAEQDRFFDLNQPAVVRWQAKRGK